MTKDDLQKILLQLVEPLKKHYSQGKAELNLGAQAAGYGIKVANMEGFSRVLWGMSPFWAGGGTEDELLEIYRIGLANGTNPMHPEYWGDLGNKDQRMVEMAAISFNILLDKEQLWNTLSEQEKSNLASWLNQINHYSTADNNWHFFTTLTNLALKSVGMPYSKEKIQYSIDKYESFYLGNGWYSDGNRPQKDYYISFAIHYYCLLYAKFMENEDPARARLYKERAAKFAKTFIYWFDDEGKALPFGRSLTYRFAQAAFWSAFVFAEVDSSYLGVIKGIISRHMHYWMSQPIFDNGGVMSIGYCYPNLHMAEGYNSPGSPYWSFKVFAILALPDNHPFWEVKEEPLPQLDSVFTIKECDMVMQHRKGEVVALTAGQYPTIYQTHAAEKYAKFAYSSRFGFSVPRSTQTLEECAPDSMLAFYVHGNIYVRKQCLEYTIKDNQIYAKWSPVEGIEVETTLIPTDKGHIRKHKITSTLECLAYDCGFSYPRTSAMQSEVSEGYGKVFDDNGYSMISSKSGVGKILNSAPNTNLIYPLSVIPFIEYNIGVGTQSIESEIQTAFKEGIIVTGKGECYELQDNTGTESLHR